MNENVKYAEPVVVDDMADCFFYHHMNLPGIGVVGAQWDLRDCINEYLGNFDFTGKRTLDVGAASGYLTFEMEKRGANVVSFDMADGAQWNIVPHINLQPTLKEIANKRSARHKQLKNAYWFAHKKLHSRANAYYGEIYNLPETLGRFEVAMFGMILSHLRDPFQALYSVSRLVTDTIIITNQVFSSERPVTYFIPTSENQSRDAWWGFSDTCIKNMLGVLGFEVRRTVTASAKCTVKGRVGYEPCTAFVAQRLQPLV